MPRATTLLTSFTAAGKPRPPVFCPSCGAIAARFCLQAGHVFRMCRCCDWWRIEAADGRVEKVNPRYSDDDG